MFDRKEGENVADLSMCKYEKCEKKDTCYRFKATPNPYEQSYMKFENICDIQNDFQWYWKI